MRTFLPPTTVNARAAMEPPAPLPMMIRSNWLRVVLPRTPGTFDGNVLMRTLPWEVRCARRGDLDQQRQELVRDRVDAAEVLIGIGGGIRLVSALVVARGRRVEYGVPQWLTVAVIADEVPADPIDIAAVF